MSLKNEISAFIRSQYPNWVNGAVLEEKCVKNEFGGHYKASNASRRARELEKAGIIEKRINGSVEYRYKPPEPPKEEKKELEEKPTQHLFTYNLPKEHSIWRL